MKPHFIFRNSKECEYIYNLIDSPGKNIQLFEIGKTIPRKNLVNDVIIKYRN